MKKILYPLLHSSIKVTLIFYKEDIGSLCDVRLWIITWRTWRHQLTCLHAGCQPTKFWDGKLSFSATVHLLILAARWMSSCISILTLLISISRQTMQRIRPLHFSTTTVIHISLHTCNGLHMYSHLDHPLSVIKSGNWSAFDDSLKCTLNHRVSRLFM